MKHDLHLHIFRFSINTKVGTFFLLQETVSTLQPHQTRRFYEHTSEDHIQQHDPSSDPSLTMRRMVNIGILDTFSCWHYDAAQQMMNVVGLMLFCSQLTDIYLFFLKIIFELFLLYFVKNRWTGNKTINTTCDIVWLMVISLQINY